MTRILIADDHELLRRGLRDILVSHLPGVEVGEARSAAEAVDSLVQQSWDLVLLDISMPGRSGLEVLEEARRLRPRTPVLILTSYPEEHWAIRAFTLGAAGYITKQEASDQLMVAIGRVLGGGKYVTASLAERLAANLGGAPERAPHEALSARELQVLRLIAVGRTAKEIADELVLSEKTIATYRQRIADKTGLRTTVEVARYALKQGLVE